MILFVFINFKLDKQRLILTLLMGCCIIHQRNIYNTVFSVCLCNILFAQELETKVAEDYAKFNNHGET